MSLTGALAGLLFLCGLLGFGIVVIWAMMFDGQGVQGGTSGFLGMKDTDDYPKPNAGPEQSGWRPNKSK